MTEIKLIFDNKGIATVGTEVTVEAVQENTNIELLYKFMVFINGVWTTISDFSEESKIKWEPKGNGKFMFMVQGKKLESAKPFDYVARDFLEVSDSIEEQLIQQVDINKNELVLSDKLVITVTGNVEEALYRFWLNTKQGWEIIKDYTKENVLNYTCNECGDKEILIEAKTVDSKEKVDEFKTVRFKVKNKEALEITNFECLTEKLLVNEELIFKVECNLDDKRNLLYKFLKVDNNGKVTSLQDYSSMKIVNFKESNKGKYRLLCLVRDMFSTKEYDDRAVIVYEVKPYEDIRISKLTSDLVSPQVVGAEVFYTPIVEGGNELVYKYVVEGTISEDSGYTRSPGFVWKSKEPGEYKVTLFVKDISFDGEYEDKISSEFFIEKKGEKPVKINEVKTNIGKYCLVGRPVNIKVMAEGGTALKYSFIVYNDGVESERIDFGSANWVNFTPEEKGNYEIEIRVVDKYSKKEYDGHSFVNLKVREYMPADIDYVLTGSKEYYLVGDTIDIELILQNTNKTLLKYVTKINGREVEATDYLNSRKLKIKPKVPGKYTFEIYAKNIKCKEGFDSKRVVNVYVHECSPVTDTKLIPSKETTKVNEDITFNVESNGGKEVCYEFYIMEKGNWIRTQEYSRKNFYTFLPFSPGRYRILVLSKSYHKKVNYEDHATYEFEVE